MRSRILSVLFTATTLTGCAGIYVAPVVPPPGILFARHAGPIDIDAQATKLGGKVGRSTVESILGLISTGDASVRAAARAGGISTIRHVDYEFENLLGVYSKFTIVVYGD